MWNAHKGTHTVADFLPDNLASAHDDTVLGSVFTAVRHALE
jgi:hypothetical protein